MHTRDERAEMESERRRIALSQTPEAWADKELRDKAEMTARFLDWKKGGSDGE